MSFKFNYGHGVAIALALFVVFISFFVYRSIADPNMNHSLVSEEYYKDELYFQGEIDRLNNADKLAHNVRVETSKKGIEFFFPPDFDFHNITGTLNLQRLENASLDYNMVIKLDSLSFLVPDKNLVKGRYNLKLNWDYNNIPYQLKQKIDY